MWIISLAIDGGTLAGDPKDKPSQSFAWPGPAPAVSLLVRFGSSPDLTVVQTSGLWAIWHFLDTAERGSWPNPEWIVRSNAGPMTVKGHQVTVKFSVDASSAQVLRPQFLSGLGCPGTAVR